MSYGLEVWNAAGAKILSITDRLGRYIGAVSSPALGPNQSVTIPVPGMTTDGTWWITHSSPWFIGVRVVHGGVQVATPNHALSSAPAMTIRVWRG